VGQHRAEVPVGTKVKGKVVNLVPYGAFVELEPGVEGLVHVTELSWTKRIAKPSDVLKQGPGNRSRRARHQPRRAEDLPRHPPTRNQPVGQRPGEVPPGTQVKGKIRNLTSYGAFIELEEGLDGMIHVSDISWTRKINHPSEVLKKGDEVEAVVLEVDKANQRIALGVKQLANRSVGTHRQFYKVGDLVTGKVTKLASFGAFIGLQHDIDGLVHISQVSEERVDKIKNVLKVGQEVTARVIKIDRANAASACPSRPPTTRPNSSRPNRPVLDALKPGEDLVALQHAFDAADDGPPARGGAAAGFSGPVVDHPACGTAPHPAGRERDPRVGVNGVVAAKVQPQERRGRFVGLFWQIQQQVEMERAPLTERKHTNLTTPCLTLEGGVVGLPGLKVYRAAELRGAAVDLSAEEFEDLGAALVTPHPGVPNRLAAGHDPWIGEGVGRYLGLVVVCLGRGNRRADGGDAEKAARE
jgi:predicted RNA-binding protein with RPS1 domain